MFILAAPFCLVLGHKRNRRRVWHDHLDLRAPCGRCGTPLIRSADRGWRPFLPADDHPDRISRDAYRDQLKRERELGAATGERPEQWGRQLIATLGDPAHPPALEPATLFERLLADLRREPAFVAAVATGRLDAAARSAVGTACARLIVAARPLPGQFLDPLVRYLFARARAGGAEALPAGMPAAD